MRRRVTIQAIVLLVAIVFTNCRRVSAQDAEKHATAESIKHGLNIKDCGNDLEHKETPAKHEARRVKVIKHYYDPEIQAPTPYQASIPDNVFSPSHFIKHYWAGPPSPPAPSPLATPSLRATDPCPEIPFEVRILVGLIGRPADVFPQELEVLKQSFINTYLSLECGDRKIDNITIVEDEGIIFDVTARRRRLQDSTNYRSFTYLFIVSGSCKGCNENPRLFTGGVARRKLGQENFWDPEQHYLREEMKRNLQDDPCACPAPAQEDFIVAYNDTVTSLVAAGILTNVVSITDNFAELEKVNCADEVTELESFGTITFQGDPNAPPSDDELRALETSCVEAYNAAGVLNSQTCDLLFVIARGVVFSPFADENVRRQERMLQSGEYKFNVELSRSCRGCNTNERIWGESQGRRTLQSTWSSVKVEPLPQPSSGRHLQTSLTDGCFCPIGNPEARLPSEKDFDVLYNGFIAFQRGEGEVTSIVTYDILL